MHNMNISVLSSDKITPEQIKTTSDLLKSINPTKIKLLSSYALTLLLDSLKYKNLNVIKLENENRALPINCNVIEFKTEEGKKYNLLDCDVFITILDYKNKKSKLWNDHCFATKVHKNCIGILPNGDIT